VEGSMALDIKTAAELIALDPEGRGPARRAARESVLLRRVLRAFVEAAEPVRVDAIVSAFPAQTPESVHAALARLDEEDLVRIVAGRVDLAYPFSASPTPFVAELAAGRGDRYICCAIDALGVAPMLGQPVRIRSRCHHCAAPIEMSVDPSGPWAGAQGVMVWVGRRVEEERRACDSL
jgi:Alkylmercury lyase